MDGSEGASVHNLRPALAVNEIDLSISVGPGIHMDLQLGHVDSFHRILEELGPNGQNKQKKKVS